MSARCRCACGCQRVDPDLDDATSSLVECMPCCLGKHRVEAGAWQDEIEKRLAALEKRLAQVTS